MHYEGSPGLWQTLLDVLIRAGLPYAGLNVFSALVGCAATCLLLLRAPFPLAIRLVLPFTFFLCYQYAVIARSYVLLPLLLFGCAMLCREPERHPGWLTAVLALMAAVSVHGMVLSASIWVTVHLLIWRRWAGLDARARRSILAAAAAYAVAVTLGVLSAWPAHDGVFVTRPNLSLAHLGEASRKMLAGAFTGEPISSAIAVALSVPFLWRGRGLLMLALSGTLLCAIAGVIYSQVWHEGLLLLAWLFALWFSANRAKLTPLALAALILVSAPQCWWTLKSVRYDWNHAYSGSRAAARFVRQHDLSAAGLYAIGYACTGLQPYFRRNIFANVNGGAPQAYWDWSTRNHVNLDSEHLDVLRPAYVLVGYKGAFERDLWTRSVMRAGYRPIRHFDGNLFWKTRVLEPESFDLYRRGDDVH